jgi:D-serine deaminase-like pyridoxal phosphate-dependent protein
MIIEPTFLVNRQQCEKNIDKILANLQSSNTQLRPHFKTHQSALIGELFKEKGIKKITVSSFSMAEFFAKNGWRDITVAFPVNIREIDRINYLASSIQLNLLVESAETISFLAEKCHHKIEYYIKIDVGTHRTGIPSEDTAVIRSILALAETNPDMKFKGFLAHAGHSYQARSTEEIRRIYNDTADQLKKLKDDFIEDYPYLKISFGDTPTASIIKDFSGIDEIRCGNFIFYDIMQEQIGSCNLKEIAVAVACPVVAKHPSRNEIVLFGGGVHFSKDVIEYRDLGRTYGLLAESRGLNWGKTIPGAHLVRLSQEHGILQVPDHIMNTIAIGDFVHVLPVHSCMVANLMKKNTRII